MEKTTFENARMEAGLAIAAMVLGVAMLFSPVFGAWLKPLSAFPLFAFVFLLLLKQVLIVDPLDRSYRYGIGVFPLMFWQEGRFSNFRSIRLDVSGNGSTEFGGAGNVYAVDLVWKAGIPKAFRLHQAADFDDVEQEANAFAAYFNLPVEVSTKLDFLMDQIRKSRP